MTKDRPFVYVVDDDESVRRALSRLLRSAGYAVESFESASEFMINARFSSKDCLILDVRMPGMTGLELLDHLAQTGNEIPTILITAHEEEYIRPPNRPAVVACLQKPFDDEEILGIIDQM